MALPTPPSSSFHSAAQSLSSSPFTDPSTVLVPPGSPISPSPLSLWNSSMRPPCAFDAEASDDSSWSNAHGLCDIDPLLHSAKVRTCDVFVGYCEGCPSVTRFVKWLRAELEMQGFSCFLSDRSRLRDARSVAVVRTTMEAAAFGMVVVTRNSFSNPYSVEELRMFLDMRKLIPIFFGLAQSECMPRDIVEKKGFLWERDGGQCWNRYGGIEKDWMEAVDGLSRVDMKLEARQDNMRDCILEIVRILGTTLGRISTVERVRKWRELAAEEFMFPRNASFVGRKRELLELELLLFGEAAGREEELDQVERSRGEYRRRIEERGVKISEDTARKGKEPIVLMESDDEIEFLQGFGSRERMVGRGIAVVTGESGIGKTELLIEFAYKFSQRYKMVLWVGGEARYLRRNYMKLLPLLGVDVDVVAQNELSLDRQGGGPKSFAEMEGEAIGKVRREMMRDIPFLLVIDNLEMEEDWWDGRNVMELLPRFGGETHVLISTRLSNVISVQPLRLLHLSAGEAMSLMRGTLGDLPTEDVDALRALEEKVGRLPLALALVGAILSEMPINPLKLLEKINRMPYRKMVWNGKKEDPVLRHNPFLVKLLDLCFSFLNHAEKFKKPSIRMLHASSWLAPAPVPVSTLVLALMEVPEGSHAIQLWKKCRRRFACMCIKPRAQNFEVELADMMVRLRIVRGCTKIGYIYMHDIIKLYARKTDYSSIAHAIVQAITTGGSIQGHYEHAWATCFLVFKFSIDPSIVDLSVQDMVSFIKKIVLPLAMHDLKAFSQYTSVLELLRLATEKLEAMEDSFLSEGDNSSNKSAVQIAPNIYYEFAHLRATLLESRAKLMIRGGLYDIGEQLYRKALNIKEVICGWEHPETQATRQIIEKLISLQTNF
ncbi:hypothetical protein J5N97_028910 [Dioscorea zingiberensis]|uniref:TIR domain-containing protein n=1 Tax=Dioscorea zingiberensis TaxID=325984 RepID=A0A9D5C0B4_9LILI|nr:hypothetical protein J5N97_028910 [Dioscorea zingiberensis]